MSDDEPISITEDPNDPWVGQHLADYYIIRRIGEGGMGVVYLARHQSLDRLAAIKFLGAHMVNDKDYIERFLLEARGAAKLNHRNLITVHDAGSLGENVYYLIMEFIEGRDLGLLLSERGVFPASEACGYIRQAASALGYAHQKKIIHRDIKPSNLLLTDDGTIKVGDLGLAKWLGDDDGGGMTQTGIIMGTPYYISPEQVRNSRDVDWRSDIYSLGATLHHLVTGRIPYEGTSLAVIMTMHLNDPVPEPNRVNPALDKSICAIIRKMMAKDPADRFQTMEEVEAVLKTYLQGGSVNAQVAPGKRKSKTRTFWIALVCVMAIAAATSYMVVNLLKEPAQEKPAEKSPPPPPAPSIAPTHVAPKLVADFNRKNLEDSHSGQFGAWNSKSPFPLGQCSERVEEGAGPDGSPCWRIQCAITTPQSFGGAWYALKGMDGTPYNTLTFKARTDEPELKFAVDFKIMQGSTPFFGKPFALSAGQQWKTFEVPLSSFGLPTLQYLDHVAVVFNREITGPRDAVLFIDDIVLSQK